MMAPLAIVGGVMLVLLGASMLANAWRYAGHVHDSHSDELTPRTNFICSFAALFVWAAAGLWLGVTGLRLMGVLSS